MADSPRSPEKRKKPQRKGGPPKMDDPAFMSFMDQITKFQTALEADLVGEAQ
jgi:hypothetical protein